MANPYTVCSCFLHVVNVGIPLQGLRAEGLDIYCFREALLQYDREEPRPPEVRQLETSMAAPYLQSIREIHALVEKRENVGAEHWVGVESKAHEEVLHGLKIALAQIKGALSDMTSASTPETKSNDGEAWVQYGSLKQEEARVEERIDDVKKLLYFPPHKGEGKRGSV